MIELRELTGTCFEKLRFFVADVLTGDCVEIKGLPRRRWWNPTAWYAPGWDVEDYAPVDTFAEAGHVYNWFLKNISGFSHLAEADLLKLEGPKMFSLVPVVWLDEYLSWVSEQTGWAKDRVPRSVARLVHDSGTERGYGRFPFHFPILPVKLLNEWRAKMEGTCKACGKASLRLKVCAGCKRVRYCDTTCQKANWGEHRDDCIDPGPSQIGVRIPAVTVSRGHPLQRLYQGGEHMCWGYFGCFLSDLQLGDWWRMLYRKLRMDGQIVTDDARPGMILPLAIQMMRVGKAVSILFDDWAAGSVRGLVIPSLEIKRDSAGVKMRECVIVQGRICPSYEVELDLGMMFVRGAMGTIIGRVDLSADRAARWLSTAVASVRRYPFDVVE